LGLALERLHRSQLYPSLCYRQRKRLTYHFIHLENCTMLAIIGGTGLYDLPGLVINQRISGDTPFGTPSGDILQGRLYDKEVLFLARHGAGHRLLPHEVNYRANVFALKRAGAQMLLGFSAVGSLALEVRPGDLAMPEQYFDWTRGQRERSFFGHGVAAHVSTARPVSAALVEAAVAAGQAAGLAVHRGLTYACVEGPTPGHAGRKPLPAPGWMPSGWHDQCARSLSGTRSPNGLRHGGPGHGLRLLAG
jgi:purine nucleoside phosphorylase